MRHRDLTALFVASVSEDFMLCPIDARDGKVIREVAHDQGIDAVRVSHDGKWPATGEEHTTNARGGVRHPLNLGARRS